MRVPALLQQRSACWMLQLSLLLAVIFSSSTAASAAPAQQQPDMSNATAFTPMHRGYKSQCSAKHSTSAACTGSFGQYCARCNKAATTCLCCKAGAAMLPSGVCQACPKGSYSAANGATACTPCALGYTTLRPGSSSSKCSACLPGYSVRQAAASSTVTEHGTMRYYCDKCPVGYISTGGPFAANVQCHPCPAGSSTAAPGSRLCDVCLPGYAGIRCLPCAKGFYGGGGNNSVALKCMRYPAGSTTAATGAKTLDECIPTSDPCAGKTCNYHGSCNAGICSCVGGWSGADCENPPLASPSPAPSPTPDPCAGKTCSFHGVCKEGICNCDPDWSGPNCNIPDPCMGKNCNNHGQCSAGVCRCDIGWSGPDCKTADPCAGITCSNHGVCSAGVCTCEPIWKGSDCSIAQEATIAIIPSQGGSASIAGVVSVTAPGDTFTDASHSVNAVIAFASSVSVAAPLMGAVKALYNIPEYSTNMVTITIKENTQPTQPFSVTLFTGVGNPWTSQQPLTSSHELCVVYLNSWDPTGDGSNARLTVEVVQDESGVVGANAASITVALPPHAFRRVISGSKVQYVANVMLAARYKTAGSQRRRSLLEGQAAGLESRAAASMEQRSTAASLPEHVAVAANQSADSSQDTPVDLSPTAAASAAAGFASPCLGASLSSPLGPSIDFEILTQFGTAVIPSSSSSGYDEQFMPGLGLGAAGAASGSSSLDVYAAHAGQVVEVAVHPYLGRYIVVQGDASRLGGTLYAPVAAAAGIEVGQSVQAGAKLGTLLAMPGTARLTLHFVYAVPVAPTRAYTVIDTMNCFTP